MRMKNLFSTFLLFLAVCTAAAAQNPVTVFAESVKGRCVKAEYTFVYKSGGIPVNGSGSLSFQGSAFCLSGNGLRIICDGSTRWTVDEESKECYIETVESTSPDYEQNPALLLTALDKAFSTPPAAKASNLSGHSTTSVSLTPLKGNTYLKGVTAHFLSDGSLYALVVTLKDGGVTTVTLKNLKKEKPVNLSPAFTLDTSTLDSSYVITDLR